MTTNETLLLRNTRKDIEKRDMPKRYDAACSGVVEAANGRNLDIEDMAFSSGSAFVIASGALGIRSRGQLAGYITFVKHRVDDDVPA